MASEYACLVLSVRASLMPCLATGAPHPHPAASPESREHFADFLTKQLNQAPDSTAHHRNTTGMAFRYFWEAPPRFWNPRVRELEDSEMEAIMVRFWPWYILIIHNSNVW